MVPASSTSLTLSWTNADVLATTQIYRNGSLLTTKTAGTASHLDTTVSSGVNYNYMVRHLKSGVYSPFGPTIVGYSKPATPYGDTATAVGSSVTYSWTNPSSLLSTKVYRDGVLITTVAPGISTFNETVADATYGYTAVATDGSNDSDVSAGAIVTVNTTLPAPTSLGAIVTTNTVALSWTNSGAYQTRIYKDGALLTTKTIGATTHSDTGVANGSHSYVARHYNGSMESGDSNTVTPSVAYLPPPTGLSLDNSVYADRVTLTWTNGTSAAIDIYRRHGGGYTLIASVVAGTTGYEDDAVVVSSGYDYKLQHNDGTYTSAFTSIASVTTSTPTFSGVTLTPNIGTNNITLVWTLTNPVQSGTTQLTGWTDSLGESSSAVVSAIASPYDIPWDHDILSGTHPGANVALSGLELLDRFGVTVASTSGQFTETFAYDPGE